MITDQNYENKIEIKINIRLDSNNLKIENFKGGELIVIQEENGLEVNCKFFKILIIIITSVERKGKADFERVDTNRF